MLCAGAAVPPTSIEAGGAVTEIVAIDIGGTHARFALAEVANGRVAALGEACTLRTAEHASLQTAWEDFAGRAGRPLARPSRFAPRPSPPMPHAFPLPAAGAFA